ncbi:MAG: helix-turn-helix domain-containing protein [Lachnospiraceae bacterium]|nr:helix-turn-helix domain-containing protein [Lachnospiraceae bacterium]
MNYLFDYPVINTEAAGQRIRELRMQNHLTVEGVADSLGLESVQAIYKWQRGESLPSVDNLYALSKLLGTTIEYILEGDHSREYEDDEQSSSCHIWKYFSFFKPGVYSEKLSTC